MAAKKAKGGLLEGHVVTDWFRLDTRKRVFYYEVGGIPEQVAQRGDGCPIPGNIQVRAGWGSEQCDLTERIPADSRGWTR